MSFFKNIIHARIRPVLDKYEFLVIFVLKYVMVKDVDFFLHL